jgi:hypothetical protein
MQGRFGRAREVFIEEKSKKGVARKLDHYVWGSKSGDGLRLVDRSGFYDVYCLVIYDGSVEQKQAEARKANQKGERTDALVEAVTGGGGVDRDPNDNVVDRITGRQVKKPGEDQPQNIQVPSPTNVRAPTPDEVNKAGGGDSKPASGAKPKGKEGGSRPTEAKGIEL